MKKQNKIHWKLKRKMLENAINTTIREFSKPKLAIYRTGKMSLQNRKNSANSADDKKDNLLVSSLKGV